MEEAPGGTPVGVDDPYAHAERCDHLTDDGRCRFAVEHRERDRSFATARREDDFRCPAADPDGDWEWADCSHFRCRNRDRECVRCGLEAKPMALSEERPLLEEHHLSYPEGDLSHEITVFLCRWCHSKVHNSWARVDDDVNPDPEAIAEREQRRSREQAELGFESASERYDE
jgi:hypothetical protein